MDIRIGQGIDFHRLVTGRDLWLGGLLIPSDKGELAHSDGDVLLHAICDAILGAAALRDIGYHFPDNNTDYKDADSKDLLRRCLAMAEKKGFRLINIDSTVCLEKPKLSHLIPDICKSISIITGLPGDVISVKATTTEGMGFTGTGEGVIALATVLLQR